MANYITSSGEISSGIILQNYDYMTVLYGGIANNTTIDSWGRLLVEFGGMANSTTVSSGGSFMLSGGTASNTVINYGGFFEGNSSVDDSGVKTLATAVSTIVFNGGYCGIWGIASCNTVNSGGTLCTYGSAENTTINSGGIFCVQGVAEKNVINEGGVVTFHWSGGGLSSTTVNSGAWLTLSSGNRAVSTTVLPGAVISLTGGVMSETELHSGGSIQLSSGGILYNTTILSGGSFHVAHGAASHTIINSGALLEVAVYGGTAAETSVLSGGEFFVSEGGSALHTIVSFGGNMIVSGSMAYVTSTTIHSDANMTVSDGRISGVTVKFGGSLVFSSGFLNDLSVSGGGSVALCTGIASKIRLDGDMAISGGLASETTVGSGNLEVYGPGQAYGITVSSGGSLRVFSDGRANNVTIQSGAGMLCDHGELRSVTLQRGTLLEMNSGAAQVVQISGGSLLISSGAAVAYATVSYGPKTGLVRVYSGGTAISTTVAVGESMCVLSGGTARGIKTYEESYLDFAVASDTYIAGTIGSSAFEMKDGYLSGYTVSSGCLSVHSGAAADHIVVNASGSLAVLHSGAATDTTVNSGGTMHLSGGTATGITVNSHGGAVVSSGGTVNATGISDGRMDVRSGGTAIGTTLDGGRILGDAFASGTLHVSEGGEADDTEVSSGGILFISSGGTANGAAVNSEASMFISSGGTAYGILENGGYVLVEDGADVTFLPNILSGWYPGVSPTVHAGTVVESAIVHNLYVYSGGIVNNTSAVNELEVYSGGTANHVSGYGLFVAVSGGVVNYVASAGSLFVYSGGTANNTNAERMDFTVFSGGLANETILNSGEGLRVESGGTANNTTINYGGYMVMSGGTANNTTVSGAYVFNDYYGYEVGGWIIGRLSAFGGAINHTTVDIGGNLHIDSGGIADDLTVADGASLYLGAGTSATNLVLSSGAYMTFTVAPDTYVCGMSAGSAFEIIGPSVTSYTVKCDVNMDVASGGTADYTSVIGGEVTVRTGGVVNNTTLSSYIGLYSYEDDDREIMMSVLSAGHLVVSSGGTANNTTINSGGCFVVSSGGTATGITVNSHGGAVVSSGGTVNSTILNSGGSFFVSSGGTANNTTINSGGSFVVSSGGTANNTTINSGGSFVVSSGASANRTEINYMGKMFIASGALVNETSIGSGGRVFIASGGTAAGTVVSSGGRMHVSSGGSIASSTIVHSGGKLTGYFRYKDVTFDSGSVLYLDASDEQNLFVDLDGYSGSQDAPSCAILIADSQKTGTYKLACNAWDFDQTISIVNDVAELATIFIGNTVEINGNDYTLNMDDGDLVLTVTCLDPQYVYLDFDGESNARFSNTDMDLSLSVSVQDPGFSEIQKQAILSGLSEQYGRNGIIFTLERPEDAEYSTLYFGKSDAFDDCGEFFGIAEAYDGNNRCRDDDAFVLLDRSYSDEQILSIACNMLERIMGYSCLKYDDTDIRRHAQSKYLLSTEWSQGEPYSKYCPIDPVAEARSVVGCTSTAAAQIINYWIENGMLDFTLSLENSDAYTSVNTKYNAVITIDSSDSPPDGNLSFAETNRLLADYEPGNEDSIAALSFAAGVVQRAAYSAYSTSTAWSEELFYRSGFEKTISMDHFSREWVLRSGALDYTNDLFSSETYDTIIHELVQGHPVGISICKDSIAGCHALIIDGYDSSTGMFHLNFGWRGLYDQWYYETRLITVCEVIAGIAPIVFPDLEIGNLSVDADHVYLNDDITLRFTVSNEGSESTASFAYVYNGDELLGWTGFSHISPGESRNVACTVSASALPAGENTLTVKVYTQKEEDSVSSASVTILHSAEVKPQIQYLAGRFAEDGKSMLAKQADGVVTVYREGATWGTGLVLDPGWNVVGTGDFNADGRDDFLRVNTEGYVVGEMANDNGTFSPQVLNLKNAGWDILGTGNFDGVGADDVLIANPTAASETVGLLGYWKGGTEWTLINGYSPEWTMVSTGDFNGDGKCDMLWKNEFIGEGGLTYNAYCTWIVEDPVDWRMVSVANPAEWNFLCSGDFDGNGSHDIAMINDVGVVGIWGVNDGYLNSWSILSAVDTSAWTLAGVGDFNADGTDDIAWASDSLGLAGYWQINDKQLTTWQNIATIA